MNFDSLLQDIRVELRLVGNESGKVRAICSVEFVFVQAGSIWVDGFRVVESPNQKFWVAQPSRRGSEKYFKTVELKGAIKGLVETAILTQFERVRQTAKNG
ncbi:MAG: hypothetical protein LAO31_13040 [Acidobacteriia bacterium]|nr:hypothetical protein [Terriglobia bacterium]